MFGALKLNLSSVTYGSGRFSDVFTHFNIPNQSECRNKVSRLIKSPKLFESDWSTLSECCG